MRMYESLGDLCIFQGKKSECIGGIEVYDQVVGFLCVG